MFNLWQTLKTSSVGVKFLIAALAAIWLLVVVAFVGSLFLLRERPTEAQLPDTVPGSPAIALSPSTGPYNAPVIVTGRDWSPNGIVFLYLAPATETNLPNFAVANATVDAQGQFTTTIFIPADARWQDEGLVKVVARAAEGNTTGQAFYSPLPEVEGPTSEPLPGTTPEPVLPDLTPTPTPITDTPVPPTSTSTPEPGSPLLLSLTDLNIRRGPGTQYPILGILRADQTAEITGLSPDRKWWQIKFSGTPEGRGWVAAAYVDTKNTANVPIVQPPAAPQPKPTNIPTPVTITDWRGEYYSNPDLQGLPVLVRNDAAINFDWGNGAPASGLNADNFSARWTRIFNFPAGSYRFYARTDDGLRLWIDNMLVIDQWRDSAPTTYTVDVNLSNGPHALKMEYFERSGGALAQLSWEWLESYPDWRGEYFSNPNLYGVPVVVRNDPVLQFSWGPNAPVAGLPADKFSARWSRNLYFAAGTYRFRVTVDDGARLWLDDNLIIDRWRAGAPATFTAEVTLTEGTHRLRLEYFDDIYDAQIRLDWERLSVSYPDWKAEYFTNRRLEGNPMLVRNEGKIDYNWGTGSPATGIPADNFSVRWSRKATFEDGVYQLRLRVDDGARLWIDDVLVIDSWRDGGARTLEVEQPLSAGQHKLKLEYYERSGDALVELMWKKKDQPANQLPEANPGGPYTVDEGGQVTLNGSTSKDPDGSIAKFEWDLDYNGRDFVVDAVGPAVTTKYSDGPTTVTVALRVTDNKGGTQIATTRVTVANVAPTVQAGGPYTGQTGSLITLTGAAFDPGTIDQSGLLYRWHFGDGQSATGPVVSHSYEQSGSYTVRLTVTDKDGAQGTTSSTVNVTPKEPPANQPPQAVISAPSAGQVNQPLAFDGSGSGDSDGSINSYLWEFGDGQSATGPVVSHSYEQPGSYTVRLTVTDDDDATDTASTTVTITAPPANQPPQAVISAPSAGQVNEPLAFDGSGSGDSDGSIVSYVWNFGDGSAEMSGSQVLYSYSISDTYIVSLTVTDDQGTTDTATAPVTIGPVVAPNTPF